MYLPDDDHGEALLTRWGPDGLGNLGIERLTYRKIFPFIHHFAPFRPTLDYSHKGSYSTRKPGSRDQ